MYTDIFGMHEGQDLRFAGRGGCGDHLGGGRNRHGMGMGMAEEKAADWSMKSAEADPDAVLDAAAWRFRAAWRLRAGLREGRGRLFDAGDVKLVILGLLSEQPSYGYQLIKTMEQRLAGGYTPSAGVIYPTLTMLEEEGLATASSQNNKKVYSLTAEGTKYLEANKEQLGELFQRLEETRRAFERGRSPEIMKAFLDLRGAVAARVSRESIKPEQIRQITEAIHAAARAIDEL